MSLPAWTERGPPFPNTPTATRLADAVLMNEDERVRHDASLSSRRSKGQTAAGHNDTAAEAELRRLIELHQIDDAVYVAPDS